MLERVPNNVQILKKVDILEGTHAKGVHFESQSLSSQDTET